MHQVKTEFKKENRKKQSVYVSIHLRNRLRKGSNEAIKLVLILKSISIRYSVCKIVLSRGVHFYSGDFMIHICSGHCHLVVAGSTVVSRGQISPKTNFRIKSSLPSKLN